MYRLFPRARDFDTGLDLLFLHDDDADDDGGCDSAATAAQLALLPSDDTLGRAWESNLFIFPIEIQKESVEVVTKPTAFWSCFVRGGIFIFELDASAVDFWIYLKTNPISSELPSHYVSIAVQVQDRPRMSCCARMAHCNSSYAS